MLEALTIGDIVRPNSDPSSVDIDAPTGVIREVSDHSGHLRLLVRSGASIQGLLHVRDSLDAPADARARDLMRDVLTLSTGTPVYEALATMRNTRSHIAIVRDDAGQLIGLITLADVLARLMPTTGTPA